ncbi:decaprenylphospho-beta-D-erythro-pentofuranosid-2-ulose 2-reductase [Embleya scabrispora]|uniref:decaprenylphospho-beta-D-erythro-pentofuranosid- 2-ulose 2-reductase n=1 Tax=Embleya scabrispora TaxID=159449 RepID=UPI00036DD85C|nr:decaprenylphospho-beta-D-erythro-pentofuranosid-2-ulose 2-reductase [Embleya scabrispora]MYS81753.1 decaprenylphospho-beta-D-erythro-pentofuranosid-2-ulose 2-reductase [Streptomyces sp. SID5474]
MKDALGAPQSLLVLGGTSEIALTTARAMVAERVRRVVLAGRPSAALDAAAEQLRGLGATVEVVGFDAAETDDHEKTIDEVFAAGDIDVVLLAFGVLGDQDADEKSPAAAARVAQVNYVGGVSAGLAAANALSRQGHGALAVISSVAGERARKSNFIYGSTKAGLDAFAQGLGDKLHGTGVHVMVVRPGFVRTKMTEGLPDVPLATTPEVVAEAIVKGLRRKSSVVWVPGQFRFVMSALRHVPRPIFRKLNI